MEGKRVLVTGGAGFLGSHVVRRSLRTGAARLLNLDVLTYAGDLRRLTDVESDPRYRFLKKDIALLEDIQQIIQKEMPQIVVHLAAESHVTRSEKEADVFFRTNVEGTRLMLEGALAAGVERFLHISTDEVYGPILEGAFREEDKKPGDGQASSPYAKSKARAEDLVASYAERIPIIVARPTNAFGPYQLPEKAFARWVTRALRGAPLLVWGDGLYVRQWLYAQDFAEAIGLLAEKGEPGQIYNVGPQHDPEITNLELANWVGRYLGIPDGRVLLTRYDRPDHDRRYAVNSTKIREIGWKPRDVWRQFAETIEWYRNHPEWWKPLVPVAESIYADSPQL
jgi:dTDP-glucose 4,6-dehydratase